MTQRFDHYEVKPCAAYYDPSGEYIEEACMDADEAEEYVEAYGGKVIWALMGHLTEGGLIEIRDFDTKAEACKMVEWIIGRPHYADVESSSEAIFEVPHVPS